MRKFITAIALLTSASAFAGGCHNNDKWTGDDKLLHFTVGMSVALGSTAQTGSEWKGFLYGAGLGLAKEMVDAAGLGECTAKDFLVTAAGAAVGAKLGGWFVLPVDQQGRPGVQVGLMKTW